MKLKKKSIGALCLLLATMLLVTGCAGNKNPYQKNNAENYRVSVRFDANGGLFDTNLSVITDSYNISDLPKNGAGEVEIPLIDPSDAIRGDIDNFDAQKSGYFLAGWYAKRTEVGEGEYTYSDKWDFSTDRLKVDAAGDYSSDEPVLTLYAAWIPSFTVEYYDYHTGEALGSTTFNPMISEGIALPKWSKSTGRVVMGDFPKRDGYSFGNVYLSQDSTEPVTGEMIKHCGIVNEENGTGSNGTMKLYVEWMEGEWYHVYTANQFAKLADTDCNLIICDDMDFSNVSWPRKLTNGTFTGNILGEGYSLNNIDAEYVGKLFEEIGDGACIENLTFNFAAGAEVSGQDAICSAVSKNATLDRITISVDGNIIYPEPVSE